MKPLTLKIAGLHSFREEQVIPFDQLASRGVFGIFGSTGSGKSTILDALTLALFGRVVRAKHKTQGILNTAEDTLTVSFLFELQTTRGNQRFRVDRKYVKKDAVSVRHQHSRLIVMDAVGGDQVVAEGESNVTGAVEDLLGMKAEDFTRAVVLPQNKFAEFITLDGAGKRKMLQRLFALERYGRELTDRLQARVNLVATGLEGITGELAGLGDASGEAMARAEKLARKARAQAREVDARLKKTEHSYEKAKQIWTWQEELQQVEKGQAAHAARSGEISALEQRLEAGERAARVLPLIRARDEVAALEAEGRKAQKEAAALVQSCQTRAAHCRDVYEIAQKRLEKQGPVLLGRKSALEAAHKQEQELRNWENEIQQNLKQRQAQIQTLDKIEKSIRQQESGLGALQNEIQQVQGELARNQVTGARREQVALLNQAADLLELAAEAHVKAAAEVQRRQVTLDKATEERENTAADLAALIRRWGELRDQEEKAVPPVSDEALARQEMWLVQFRDGLDQLVKMGHRLQQAQDNVAGLVQELARLQHEQQQAGAKSEQINGHLAALQEQYQRAYLQNNRVLAARLAQDLADGAPCPVCGALEHPQPAPVVVEAALDSEQLTRLRERISRGEEIAREATARVNALAAAVLGTEARLAVARKDLEQLEQEIQTLGGRLWGGDFALPRDWNQARQGWHREAEQREQNFKEQQKQLAHWREQRQQAQALLNSLQDQLTQKRAGDAAAEQKVTAASNELAGARDVLRAAAKDWEKTNRHLQAALARLDEGQSTRAVPGVHGAGEGIKTARQALKQLQAMDRAAEEAGKRLEQLRSQMEQGRGEMEKARQDQNTLATALAGLEARLGEQQKQLTQRQETIKGVTGGKPAATVIARVQEQIYVLQQQVRTARAASEEAENKKMEAERALAGSNTYLTTMEIRLAQCRQELAEALQKNMFTTAGEATDAVLDEEETASCRQILDHYRDEEKRLQAAIRRLQELLGGNEISPSRWLALQNKLEETRNEKEEATKNLIEAEKDRQDLKHRHTRWQELEQQRQMLDRQLTHLKTLKKLLWGDRFVQFLAHEQLEFVVRQATVRLKKMTGGRYALLVDADSNFLIRDDANGGVTRPVTSLSGGETFQASLALALALSTQIQLRGRHPLEFFFLDEGFGSLDQNALETMVSTLEGLHLEQMTIGVISHVAELQQRIGCKLLVEPAQTGGRGSRVRLDFT